MAAPRGTTRDEATDESLCGRETSSRGGGTKMKGSSKVSERDPGALWGLLSKSMLLEVPPTQSARACGDVSRSQDVCNSPGSLGIPRVASENEASSELVFELLETRVWGQGSRIPGADEGLEPLADVAPRGRATTTPRVKLTQTRPRSLGSVQLGYYDVTCVSGVDGGLGEKIEENASFAGDSIPGEFPRSAKCSEKTGSRRGGKRAFSAHQVRAQLAAVGCPLLFDRYYHPVWNEEVRRNIFPGFDAPYSQGLEKSCGAAPAAWASVSAPTDPFADDLSVLREFLQGADSATGKSVSTCQEDRALPQQAESGHGVVSEALRGLKRARALADSFPTSALTLQLYGLVFPDPFRNDQVVNLALESPEAWDRIGCVTSGLGSTQ
eukprot:gene186-164_t